MVGEMVPCPRVVVEMPERAARCKIMIAIGRGPEVLGLTNRSTKNTPHHHFPNPAQLSIVLPWTLEGSAVRREPIRREHREQFWEAAKHNLEDMFRSIPYSIKAQGDFEKPVVNSLAEQEQGESVVFAAVEPSSGRVTGSTRFMNIEGVNRRAEIGSTWIAPGWQRTAISSEAT